MPGLISRTVARLSPDRPPTSSRGAAADPSTVVPIVAQDERCVCTVRGVVRSVGLRPVDGVTALEADLHDGTDGVTLVWLGRRTIAGITPGRSLTAHGRIGRRGPERIIYNPRYELGA